MSKKISISKAIGEALHEEMLRDPKVIIMGEDMGKMGNVFGITVGFRKSLAKIVSLIHLFPNRFLRYGCWRSNARHSSCCRTDV